MKPFRLLLLLILVLIASALTSTALAEDYRWPVLGTNTSAITQYYSSSHPALDIGAAAGTSIVATRSGQVAFVYTGCTAFSRNKSCSGNCSPNTGIDTANSGRCNYGYGNGVVIRHSDNTYSCYAHMQNVYVSVGQNVTQDTVIGTVGSSGNSNGAHLHFEYISGHAAAQGNYYGHSARNNISAYNVNPSAIAYVYAAGPNDNYQTDSCGCSTQYAGWYTVKALGSGLAISRGHGSSNTYGWVADMPENAMVYIDKASGYNGRGSSSGLWGHVTYNGYSGYCAMNYLQLALSTAADNCSTDFAGWYQVRNTDGSLAISAAHGSSNTYGELGSIPEYERVYVSRASGYNGLGASVGQWGHVNYNGISGYSAMNYLDKLVTFALTFDSNGGEGGPGTVTAFIGYADYYDVATFKPTRDGYEFLGWFDVNGHQVYGSNGICLNEGYYWNNNKYIYYADTTLYAHWRALDSVPPVISNVQLSHVSGENMQFDIGCDVSDNLGVASVQFRIWSENNGQDDLEIANAVQNGNRWTYRVSTYNGHNFEFDCWFRVEIVATDAAGNRTVYDDLNLRIYVDVDAPEITNITVSDVDFSGYTVSCDVSDATDVESVLVSVWTVQNPSADDSVNQDDMRTVRASVENGHASCRIQTADHQYAAECLYRTVITAADSIGNTGSAAAEDVYVIAAMEDMDCLTLPASLTAIGEEAFLGIDAELVVVPEGCTSIGARAFADCMRLRYIVLPKSMRSIAENAFENDGNVYAISPNGNYWVSGSANSPIYASSISLSRTSMTMNVGTPVQLTAAIQPVNATCRTIKWTTSNSSVATVSENGIVTPVGGGSCLIYAETEDDSGVRAACRVTVNGAAYVPVSAVHLNTNSMELGLEIYGQLDASVLPENASNPALRWVSSNPNIASVSEDGFITPLSVGTVTITAVSLDNEALSDSCEIVIPNPFTPVESISIGNSTAAISVGGTWQITAAVLPENATNPALTFQSSNTAVATVSASGVITGVSRGTAAITVTAADGSGRSAVMQVAVSEVCTCSSAYAGYYVVHTGGDTLAVNDGHGYRSDLGFSQLTEIPDGSVVYISEASAASGTSGAWGHITYNGISGYCSMAYLKPQSSGGGSSSETDTSSCGCSTAYAGRYMVFNTNGSLALNSAHKAGSQIASLPEGAIVTVTAASGNGSGKWAHVTYDGKSGYASMYYLAKLPAAEDASAVSGASTATILARLNASGSFSSAKKPAVLKIAELMLNDGYEPAFVAGVIANVLHEGTFGQFESSAYSSNEPSYLVYMDNNFAYRTKYSNKLVYNGIDLNELYSMLNTLSASGWPGKFGLGSIQWTGSRTLTLVNFYRAETAGGSTISYNQVINAEMKMIEYEFKTSGGRGQKTYSAWKRALTGKYNTADAAYAAGYFTCVLYEAPGNMYTHAVTRGNTAKQVFNIMMGR